MTNICDCAGASRLFRVQVDGHNQTVQTQHFGENQDQNHADKQARLLGSAADASITDNADGKAGGEAGETDRQTSAQMDEAPAARMNGMISVRVTG